MQSWQRNIMALRPSSICHEPECDNNISIPMHHSGQPIRGEAIHRTHEPHSIYSSRSPFHLHSDLRDSHLLLRALYHLWNYPYHHDS